MHKKKLHIEQGYLILFLLFGLLVLTVVESLVVQRIILNRAYEIAQMNFILAEQGIYTTQNYVVDMSVYNWIIGAINGALAIALSAQFKKKARNNTDENIQKWLNELKNDPDIKPRIPEIIMAYLQTNQNN